MDVANRPDSPMLYQRPMLCQRSDKDVAACKTWKSVTPNAPLPPLCPSCPRKPALGVGMAKRWPMSASLKDALIKNFPVPVTRFFFLPFSVPNLHPNIVNQNSPPPLLKHSNTRTPRVQHLPTRIDPLTSPLMKGRSSVFTSQVCVLLLCCCMLRKQSIYPAILHGRAISKSTSRTPFSTPTRHNTQWHPNWLPSHPTAVLFQIHVH